MTAPTNLWATPLVWSVLLAAPLLAQQSDADYVRENYTKLETQIPMRDGVKLFTSIYVPKGSQKQPIMLQRTPYGVSPYGKRYKTRLGPSSLFLRSGYVFAYQDVRGKYMSEGEFVAVRPHIAKKRRGDIDESTDTYDTIAWLLENVPNNGKVGAWGISAPGFYATHTLIDAHPALKAVSPQAPVTDWFLGDDRHHNGAFMFQASFSFLSSYGRQRPKPTTRRSRGFRDYGTPDGYRWYLDLGPIATINEKYLKGQNALWNAMVDHGNYDAWWQARTPLPHLHGVKPAVLVVGGFFDAQDLYGPLKTYAAIDTKSPRTTNHLVMGPWWHGGWARGAGDRYQDIWFEKKTGPYYRENIEFPFFEHYLKGKPNPNLAKAQAFLTGSNQWKSFQQWPPREGTPTELYLLAGGGVSLYPPIKDGFDEYVSDPAKPVPHTPDIVIRRDDRYVVQDQRFASTRPDVLVYESPPLDRDITMAGELLAELYVSTTGTDADFIVKLIDVYPNDATYVGENRRNVKMGGFQFMVRGEVMRAKFRNSFERPEPLKPGEVTKVAFDMQDVAHTFLKGHKIMVQIQSTWFPLVDRNPQKFVDIYKAKADDFQKATHRIYATKLHPSRLRFRMLK